jgi:hypothetical protein
MQNVDELCIKYVLNELDSSEKLQVEQAMREDENILIEIESLKLTLKKLEQLPHKAPPEYVQQKVLQMALQQRQKRTKGFQYSWKQVTYLAAAAVLILAGGLGWAQINQNQPGVAGSAEVNSAAITGNTANTDGNTVIEPWVDRQNILYINVTQGPGGLSIAQPNQADVQHAGTLRPVNRTDAQPYPVMRELQLTRTTP